jgi:FKBP-type peptidyl-prolyl cis-trans isomerase FkpA
MKKLIFLSAAAVTIFASCGKTTTASYECNSLPPATIASPIEVQNLQAYLTNKNITNVTNLNGMFYTLDNAGSGTSPNLCSNIGITYRGSFINGLNDGAGFDSSLVTPRVFTLNGLIAGWQLAMPLVKLNGAITLYIPPSLAYGTAGRPPAIPANSYMKFTLNLLSVN